MRIYAGAFPERATVLRTKSLLDPYILYLEKRFIQGYGPVEGQINKLKYTKRSMYGHGSFELLRQRFLLAA
ncbi:hypothetical protein KSD_55850 [Ktedonobacter sp. SOSP1-85]|nr:hypothetical protein KSD_55850 [Ktedonobacter sp. SOSP1-85]